MKNTVTRISQLLILFLFIALSGCETETDDNTSNQNSFKIKEIPINQLLKIDKFNISIKKIGLKMDGNTDALLSRTTLEDEFNFTIVDTPAKVIEEGNKTTYTMLIERDLVDFNVIENLVIEIDDSNKMVAIIIKYNSVGEVIKTADGSYVFSTDDKEITTLLNENGNTDTNRINCISYKMCNNCVGTYTTNHFVGSQCTIAQFYYTYFECTYSTDPHNPMGYSSGNSGGGGSSGGGNSSAINTGVATSPVAGVESHAMILKKRKFYHTYLNSILLENYFMQLPATQKNAIFTYLENNSMDEGVYDEAAMALMKGMLNACLSYINQVGNTVENQSFITEILNYFIRNNFSAQSQSFVTEIMQNSNSPEAIQNNINILDLLDDGLVNGQTVLVAPTTPITNMAEYLNCFNPSLPATITIYADQPITGTHDIYSYPERVGHAFISITQGIKVKTLGFYPQCSPCSLVPNLLTLQPNDFLSTPGIFGNDSAHTYDVSLTLPLNPSGLANVINGIISIAQNNPQYNIGAINCTDLAINIFNSQVIMDIPNCESPGAWSGQTPGTLGQVIRNLDLPPGIGGVRNVNGGNSPINNPN